MLVVTELCLDSLRPALVRCGSHVRSGMPVLVDEAGCKFGKKAYWDAMYSGHGDLPADEFSWYCGWSELAPFWKELVPDTSSRILVPGVGNDAAVANLWDAGYQALTAFDYSADAVARCVRPSPPRPVPPHLAATRSIVTL